MNFFGCFFTSFRWKDQRESERKKTCIWCVSVSWRRAHRFSYITSFAVHGVRIREDIFKFVSRRFIVVVGVNFWWNTKIAFLRISIRRGVRRWYVRLACLSLHTYAYVCASNIIKPIEFRLSYLFGRWSCLCVCSRASRYTVLPAFFRPTGIWKSIEERYLIVGFGKFATFFVDNLHFSFVMKWKIHFPYRFLN